MIVQRKRYLQSFLQVCFYSVITELLSKEAKSSKVVFDMKGLTLEESQTVVMQLALRLSEFARFLTLSCADGHLSVSLVESPALNQVQIQGQNKEVLCS